MDAFYASVEQRDNPALRGKPLVVGGSADGRGVVASCSYEARKFGIRSAMSSRRALGLCPSVQFVRPRMDKYKEVSRQIRGFFHAVTPLVEPLSLDEAYLDVTENALNEPSATRIAQKLRLQIETELGLTASAGVANCKFLAKVASDIRKPNGLTVIPPEKALDFIAVLPIEKFWGVGPATAKKLHERGIKTGLDLRSQSLADLHKWFGKFGGFLHRLSMGEDSRAVCPDRERKSSGSETTFSKDTLDLSEMEKTILELAQDVAQSLEKSERGGKCVVLKVKYADFTIITRSRTVAAPIRDTKEIAAIALSLLRSSTDAGRTPIRLLGVSARLESASPVESSSPQLDLEI